MNRLPEAKTYSAAGANSDALAIDGGTTSLTELLKIYGREVASKGINAASGGHFGYIPGGSLYASALADFLAAVTNEYAGVYFASPGAAAMETELVGWLKKIFKFPESAVGNLTSGGSIATLIALAAARDKHRIKGERIAQSVVYLSAQVHHCINKALRLIGLEDVVVRYVELDEGFRIDPDKLAAQIAEDKRRNLNPFLVTASAGTTDTGAVDPLRAIGEIAARNGLWYHVDAAYGGFFILTEAKKRIFGGTELADSLIVDPHKGMFLPYGSGAVIVKDKAAVFHSNHHTAAYMQDAASEEFPPDAADLSPELTKHFRALRMWLPLRLHGVEPFASCLEEKLLLTEYFRQRLVGLGFKVGLAPDLTVSYFWYSADGLDEMAFNKKLLQTIHEDGRAFLSSTILNGKFIIRLAVLSFRSKIADVDRALEMIAAAKEKCLREFDRAAR